MPQNCAHPPGHCMAGWVDQTKLTMDILTEPQAAFLPSIKGLALGNRYTAFPFYRERSSTYYSCLIYSGNYAPKSMLMSTSIVLVVHERSNPDYPSFITVFDTR